MNKKQIKLNKNEAKWRKKLYEKNICDPFYDHESRLVIQNRFVHD